MAKDVKPLQIQTISECCIPPKQIRTLILDNFYSTHRHTFITQFHSMKRKYGLTRLFLIYVGLFFVLLSNYQGVLSIFVPITFEVLIYSVILSIITVPAAFIFLIPYYSTRKMNRVWDFMRQCYLLDIDQDFRKENENFWVQTVKETLTGGQTAIKPCGTVAVRDSTRCPPISNESGSKFASVYNLIVDGKHRGKGFGTALIEIALEFCKERKYDYVVAKTEEVNAAGVGILKSMGFQVVGLEENDKMLGSSSVVMLKKL